MKRFLDFGLALVGLVLLIPVLAVLAIVVKVSSPGPVLYRGVRAGRYGAAFRILKFRSMVAKAETAGGPSTSYNDPRVTRIGVFLRRYKLDELPQLFNVLVGEMSFVGPRPEVLTEVAEYTQEQRRILEVRPGITDWASIWNSDEGRVLAAAPDPHLAYKTRIQPTKLKLQLKYRDEQSLWTDVKLIAYTILRLARRNWIPHELKPFPEP